MKRIRKITAIISVILMLSVTIYQVGAIGEHGEYPDNVTVAGVDEVDVGSGEAYSPVNEVDVAGGDDVLPVDGTDPNEGLIFDFVEDDYLLDDWGDFGCDELAVEAAEGGFQGIGPLWATPSHSPSAMYCYYWGDLLSVDANMPNNWVTSPPDAFAFSFSMADMPPIPVGWSFERAIITYARLGDLTLVQEPFQQVGDRMVYNFPFEFGQGPGFVWQAAPAIRLYVRPDPPTIVKNARPVAPASLPVVVGDVVEYTITVNNPAVNPTIGLPGVGWVVRAFDGFQVTDELPGELTLVPGSVQVSAGVTGFVDNSAGDVVDVTFNIPGSNEAANPVVITFLATVNAYSLLVEEIINYSYLYNPNTNTRTRDRERIPVGDPPTLDKDVIYIDGEAYVGQPVAQGDLVIYRLRVNNPHDRILEDFLVTDVLPPGLALVGLDEVIPAGALVADQTAGGVLSVVLNLSPGNTDVIFTARVVDVNLAVDGEFINFAYLYGPPLPSTGERPQVDDCDATIRLIDPPTLDKDVIYIDGEAYDGQPVVQGDIVTYRLRVNNPNDRRINNFLVTDDLPPGLQLVGLQQVIPAGAYVEDLSAGDVLSVVLNLPPGDTYVIFNVLVVDESLAVDNEFINVAYLYGPPTPEGGERPQVDECTATIRLIDPPSLEKDVIYIDDVAYVGQLVVQGDIVTYRLRVYNPNPRTINNFLVTDDLPPGLELVSLVQVIPAGAFVADQSVGDVLNVVLNLPAGYTDVIFNVLVADENLAVNDRFINVAYLYGPPGEDGERPQIDDCTATIRLAYPPTLDKDVIYIDGDAYVGQRVAQGDVVTYRLRVYNPNTRTINNFLVTDALPPGLELVGLEEVIPAGAFVEDLSAGDVLSVVLNLPPGYTYVIFEVLVADASLAVDYEFINVAYLYGPPPSDGGERPQIDDCTATIRLVDPPTLEKDVIYIDGDAYVGQPVIQGDIVTYRLRVNNPNTRTINDFLVTDALPPGLALVGLEEVIPAGAYVEDLSAGDVLSVVLNLPPGDTYVIFTVEVVDVSLAVDDQFINVAYLYGPPPADGGNRPQVDDCTATIRLADPPSLDKDVIYIAGDAYVGQPVVQGDIVTYRLRVNNPNARTINDFLVTDALPPGLTLVGLEQVVPANAFVADQSAGDVLSVVLNLPPGNTDVIFNVRVADESLAVDGTFVNVAYLYGPPPTEGGERPPIDECTEIIVLADPPSLEKDIIYIAGDAYDGQPVVQGDIVTYRLRVNNPNDRTINNFLVTDDLPPGLTLVGLQQVIPTTAFVADQSVGDVLNVVLNLPPGDTDVIFTVRVSDVSLAVDDSFINVAYLYGPPITDGGDDRTQIDDCTATIVLGELPSLEKDVIYIDGDAYVGQPVSQGDIVTYRLRVNNPNDRTINDFLVTDALPPGLALVGLQQVIPTTAFVADQSVGDVLNVVLNLPPGDTDVIFTVRVADVRLAVNDSFVNVAYLYGPPITYGGDDRPQIDDCTATIVLVELPTLDKEIIYIDGDIYTGQPTAEGEVVTYRLRVNNPNERTINDFLVRDAMPPGLTLIDVEEVIPATALVEDQSAGNVLSVILNLPPGDTYIIFSATVTDGNLAVDGRITNVAYLYAPPITEGGNDRPQIDDCTATVVLRPPAVVLEKSVSSAITQPGGVLTYTLVVRNTGGIALTNVVITDDLPVELTNPRNFTFSPSGAGEGTVAGQVVTITIPRLAVNAEVAIAFAVTVAGNVEDGDVIDNTAYVTTDQNVTDDDDATTTVEVEPEDPRPNISLVKSVSSVLAYPGEDLTYTIVVRNTGNQVLTDVVVRDELPELLTNPRNLIIDPDEAGTGSITGQLVLVNIPVLGVGQAVTITFEVTVSEDAANNVVIRNIATVTTEQNVTDNDDADVTVRHPGGGGNGEPPPPPQPPQPPPGAPVTGDMGMNSPIIVVVLLSLSAIFGILSVKSFKKGTKGKR